MVLVRNPDNPGLIKFQNEVFFPSGLSSTSGVRSKIGIGATTLVTTVSRIAFTAAVREFCPTTSNGVGDGLGNGRRVS